MKKRILLLVLAAMLCLNVLPAGAEGAELSYERIVMMAEHMADLATGDYLTIHGVPEELQATAKSWAAGITGTPRLVVRTNIRDTAMLVNLRGGYMMEPEIIRMEAESTSVSEMVYYLMAYTALEGSLISEDYERMTEVNGLMNASMIYAEPGAVDGYELYIVLYEDATPLLILAIAENDAVSLTGWFLPSQRLAKCSNAGMVSLWTMMQGCSMVCEEVPSGE